MEKARIEIIYILFFYYKEEMRAIAERHGCRVNISMEFYTVKAP